MVLFKIIKLFFLVFLFNYFFLNKVFSECLAKNNLKVGIIENEFIDYKYYLLYTLGNYSIDEEIEFEIDVVNDNIDEFDIVFGEYYDLIKLSRYQIKYPNKINSFYKKNKINITDNILPLDLDTFILLSKFQESNIFFEELSTYKNPFNYTFGMSMKPKENFIKFFMYGLKENSININDINFESKINLFKSLFRNQNKNILNSNYYEIYESYQNNENIFTLFSDGILLYGDIEYEHFQLFPISNFEWDKKKGLFIKDELIKPVSFYGLSAYINNTNNVGYLCYLVDEKIRISSFKKFNINISPLSNEELVSIKNEIPDNYKKILNEKNRSILDLNYESNLQYYELITSIIEGKKEYINQIDTENYLKLE